jgi:hypothetical protein
VADLTANNRQFVPQHHDLELLELAPAGHLARPRRRAKNGRPRGPAAVTRRQKTLQGGSAADPLYKGAKRLGCHAESRVSSSGQNTVAIVAVAGRPTGSRSRIDGATWPAAGSSDG